MKTYPLIRLKITNEHIMTVLFMVLIVYQLPTWLMSPLNILSYFSVLVVALLLEVIFNLLKYSSLKCAVSASITVGIIYAVYPGIPLWGTLLGVVIALFTKYIFGGMGKNPLNPAMIGILLMSFIFPTDNILFSYSVITVLAMLLSLPFIVIRPFASLGLIIGMLISMGFTNDLTMLNVIGSGVLFWGCIVITDPATMTYKPVIGGILSLIIGVIAYRFYSIQMMAILILGLNIISFLIDKITVKASRELIKTRLKKPYKKIVYDGWNFKLDYDAISNEDGILNLASIDILHRIEKNNVLGLGGGAYPTHLKIKSFMDSISDEKYVIINAVECDPGLCHDHWLLTKFSSEINKGLKVIRQCIPESTIILATKDDQSVNFDCDVKKVRDYYPVGAEKRLIREVVNKYIAYNEIPSEKGVLVLNVQTVYSLYKSVWLNQVIKEKFITIANLMKREAHIVQVSVGDRISEVIGTIYDKENPIFVGGGLMQVRCAEVEDLITETTNYIAVAGRPKYKEGTCSKCGKCTNRCPSGLEVHKITRLVEERKIDQAKLLTPEKCLECGLCSYHCLAGKNLSMKVKEAKT